VARTSDTSELRARTAQRNIDVLLVEDSPGDAWLIRESIRDAGDWCVLRETATTLQIALDSMTTTRPDVLVLDLELPDSEGLDTFRRVQQQNTEIPVVVLSGFADEDLAV
jgi:CheY-like chemotaxis protein